MCFCNLREVTLYWKEPRAEFGSIYVSKIETGGERAVTGTDRLWVTQN